MKPDRLHPRARVIVIVIVIVVVVVMVVTRAGRGISGLAAHCQPPSLLAAAHDLQE